MRDIDGLVHEQFKSESYEGWWWSNGHGDARMRNAKPVPEGSAVTCFVCVTARRWP